MTAHHAADVGAGQVEIVADDEDHGGGKMEGSRVGLCQGEDLT